MDAVALHVPKAVSHAAHVLRRDPRCDRVPAGRSGCSRVDLARRGAGAPAVRDLDGPVRRRPAPGHRHRCGDRRPGARACGRSRLLHRFGAGRRPSRDDPDRRRVRRHAAPARRDHRRAGQRRRRGRAGRRRGSERRPGHRGAARPPRRPPRLRARGVRRSARVASCALAGSCPRSRAGSRGRARSRACPSGRRRSRARATRRHAGACRSGSRGRRRRSGTGRVGSAAPGGHADRASAPRATGTRGHRVAIGSRARTDGPASRGRACGTPARSGPSDDDRAPVPGAAEPERPGCASARGSAPSLRPRACDRADAARRHAAARGRRRRRLGPCRRAARRLAAPARRPGRRRRDRGTGRAEGCPYHGRR